MNDCVSSRVSFLQDFGPKQLIFDASEKRASVRIKMKGKIAVVETEHNGEVETHTLESGDSYVFTHTINFEATKEIDGDHPFPLRIQYGADEYRLNRTKNGKLILTK